jgi:hypothetical protein
LADLAQKDLAGASVAKELKNTQTQAQETELKLKASMQAEQDLRQQMLEKLDRDREVRLKAIPEEITKIQRKQGKLRKDFVSALANFAAIQQHISGISPDHVAQTHGLSYEERQFFTAEIGKIQKERRLDGSSLEGQIQNLRNENSRLETTVYDQNSVQFVVDQVTEKQLAEAREFFAVRRSSAP